MKQKFSCIFSHSKSLILTVALLMLSTHSVLAGQAAPNLTLKKLDNSSFQISDLKGDVVYVDFWATWCPPCREEMPSMQRLYDKMPKDKFEMIALYNNDKKQPVMNFVSQMRLTFPIWSDEHNFAGAKYGLTGLPETYIVDKNGIIREKFIGPAEWDKPETIEMLTKYINE